MFPAHAGAVGRPDIKIPRAPYVYGGDTTTLCRECQLPCKLTETSPDCLRRFFLQGMLQCTYFVYGYCFLDRPGCVFDNGAEHDQYWVHVLNDYFHNVASRGDNERDFADRRKQLLRIVEEQIKDRQVSLCRYLEEIYHRALEDGGGLSEDVMGHLDEAYLALLAGTSRKR
ncbi:MAG TPA: hypothetical protein VFH88_04480 [Candidatus Krumholzibacteria bacterium]|nr:hypothetical protein [Candidatus Krumholzibacteria bacterium]